MENNSNTGIEKSKNYLKAIIKGAGPEVDLVPSPQSQYETNDDWIYQVVETSEHLEVFDFQNDQICKLPNTPANKNNLNSVLRKFTELKNHALYKSLKINNDIRKSNLVLQRRYEKLEHYLQSKDNNLFFQTIRKLIQRISQDLVSFSDLPVLTLNSPLFRDMKTCQFLVHEKGTKKIYSYLKSRDRGSTQDTKSVKDFNRLFSHLKKSKNKVFDAANIGGELIDTIGTFLASSLELKSHNIVMILSRESFLPPIEKEISGFIFLSKSISPFLNAFMTKEKKENTLLYKYIAIKNIEFGISIFDESDSLIYSNDYRKAHPYEESSKSIELSNENKLSLYFDKNQENLTDFNHSERINLLGNLLNTLSHELSNPLFGMKLASDILLMEDLDEDGKETLRDISTNIIRSQKILGNFSQLYSDQIAEVNLIELIQETLKLAKSEMRHIRRKFHFDPKIFPVIKSNPTWISQILFNLIINASQAMNHQPPLEGFALNIDLKETGSFFQVIISDNGPGVPEDLKQKIFEPFFTTKDTGTGLGLIICKNLAKRLGGSLTLDEKHNPGARFILELKK